MLGIGSPPASVFGLLAIVFGIAKLRPLYPRGLRLGIGFVSRRRCRLSFITHKEKYYVISVVSVRSQTFFSKIKSGHCPFQNGPPGPVSTSAVLAGASAHLSKKNILRT
jgi:hypothetical protein